MKKWVITIVCLLLLTTTGLSVYFYKMMRSPIDEHEQLAVQRVLNDTDVETVEGVSFYHGTESYIVIQGLNTEDKPVIAWVGNEDERIIVKNADDGLSKEEVMQFAIRELAPKKLISTRLGMENRLPIYEITYIDENDRYSFYYITFEDGTFVKRYSLKKDV
ncbi:DUF5590 domain-containing protein [Alkalihalobacterium alkalinitrilicum]|uniref:cell wall elongation regulator TseB-like domain-containing protein n=1 Tax=Alkalihalobacterium alkalinitrilicum TaxID=427920 RepID=UPI0009951808|nr:DUF5590 domain-containing protein [Alkalihalobacterium alkalinitrilicum]